MSDIVAVGEGFESPKGSWAKTRTSYFPFCWIFYSRDGPDSYRDANFIILQYKFFNLILTCCQISWL
ncbi:hypothetical protein ACFOUP_14335 [Belliella kenyensis]|uniref:Uncharacterized protein n=1 Tax=Belliella kenyensis TaxID=1472724 RepID=A0ABV8EPD3_9BACT|nr:hypothetical protein [Belliella kenyensis]MCH7401623.1 hypothetical protein [Belliella kenyensis]